MQRITRHLRACALALLSLVSTGVLAQGGGVSGIISDRISSQVSSGLAGSVFGRPVKLDLAVSGTKGQLAGMSYQRAGSLYLQHFVDGTLLVWDFEGGAQIDEFQLPGGATAVHYDAATARLYTVTAESIVRLGRTAAGTQSSERVIPDAAHSASASGDGRWLFVATVAGELVKLGRDDKTAWRVPASQARARQIATNHDGTRVTVLDGAGSVRIFDAAGTALAELSRIARLGRYDPGGRQAHLSLDGELVFVAPDMRVTRQNVQIDAGVADFAVNDGSDRLLAVTAQGRLNVRSAGKWQQADTDIKHAVFIGERRYLSVRNDGVTHLRSAELAHYLVAIVPGGSGWVIVDHEGRYDGTVAGTNDVKWNAEGGGGLSLDQFFESHYQPGLLASYLKEQEGTVLAKVPSKVREGVFLPPSVELDFPDGAMRPGVEYKLVAIAESKGGELEEIKLFHNGKRLPPKARVGSQRVVRDGRLLLVQVFAFVPEPGPNEVFAEARNSHGVSARSPVKREVAAGVKQTGRLHIFGVGIDKYRLSAIDLDFATADVKTVVSRVAAGARQRYSAILPDVVIDGAATAQGVRNLLERLRKLQPEDSLILALAGHGDVHGGEWYFLPHDVDPENLSKTAISVREIQDALVESPARQIFLIVDACNSGAGIDGFNRYRAFQRRFAQQVGRNAGISVLTGTRRDQLASELPQLGHGLFTHVILEGLTGAADATPRDGQISAHELAEFVGRTLEQKARLYLKGRGLTQSPAHFVIGADFLIADVAR